MADKIKLLLAAVVLCGAVGAFYYFADHSLLLRVVGLLFAVGIAVAIGARTALGATTIDYLRGAVLEWRKVVWPTRKETVQTTLIIVAMVTVMGLIMWGFDAILAVLVRKLTG